ncbi:MAG TPA: cupredoxin domain-containing protein [Terriglobia bacterium]
MRQFKVGAAFALFVLALAPALRAQLMQQVVPGEVRVFQITAENYQFSPFTVIVNPGDRVRFVITAVDRDYEFKLKNFDIHEKLKQGVPTTVNFTATDSGKFTFSSPGIIHRDMKGTLVVKGATEKKKK